MSAVGVPPEHHPLDLLRGDQGGRLRRQLQGHGEAQAALHQRGPLHRLPGVHRGLRLQGAEVPRRVQRGPEQAQARSTSPSRRPRPQVVADRPGDLHRSSRPASARRPASRPAATARPSTSRRQEEFKEIKVGTIILATGFKTFDAKRDPVLRLRQLPERLHRAGGRAAGQRLRPDRRRGRPARRPDSPRRSASSTASARATRRPTAGARASAACTP